MKGRAWTRKEDEALCRAYRWILLHPSLNKWYQALLAAASRHESGANYYDEVHQVEELYMEGSSKPFQHHGYWEICKGWVLFEDPSQHRFAPTRVFGTTSSVVDVNEDGSPTIQEIRIENLLKEKGKAKDDYTAQQEVPALLGFMAEQNVFAAERHEDRAKQIQEKMDDRNMQRNTLDYNPMKEIMARRQLFTSDYTPTMADDEDDVDYGL
ncbi:hypothetical protein D8674_003857 [Pyrus ussuriensis x Pyrus communis]|uniref:Uncharacterized protein n=1 Tax=Pyrus ussuriensis x Pyrus communis TaxID=2448454 RepID=A0A5N5FNP5_9ROSA|nr:hypothetical protein D8674_003857 [Pyrus ussuriensis x Pyrus communis]